MDFWKWYSLIVTVLLGMAVVKIVLLFLGIRQSRKMGDDFYEALTGRRLTGKRRK